MSDCRYYEMCGLLKTLPQQECPGSGSCIHYEPMPDAAREEIVRCRDCEFAFEFEGGEGWPGKLDCTHFSPWDYYEDKPGHWPVEPDGFCAWGERR